MNISDLIMISIKVGKNESWSTDHTYAYYGGFITYRNGDILYAIKESTAVEDYLRLCGFTKNENAFGETINREDLEKYINTEGPDGENVRKYIAYLYDNEIKENWHKITSPKELQTKIPELINSSPYFNPTGLNFLETEWGIWASAKYEQNKQLQTR